jgi:ACR3 family arsenite efflux pump ArsB
MQQTAIQGIGKKLNFFERYLSVWVSTCMLVGVLLGKLIPALTDSLRGVEFGTGSQINAPIAVLIWLMIIPMMMKVNFGAVLNVREKPRGLMVTLFVNWQPATISVPSPISTSGPIRQYGPTSQSSASRAPASTTAVG